MRRPARSAFSLVEVLIVFGILSLVLGILFAAFSSGGRAAGRGMATLDLATSAGLVSQHLKRDLRSLFGAVPLPRFEGADSTVIRFKRFDGLTASGAARVTPVEYRVRKVAAKTLVIRAEPGSTTPYAFDRDMVVMIGSDGLSSEPGRGVSVTFGFPATAQEPARRSVRLDTMALGVTGKEEAPVPVPSAAGPAPLAGPEVQPLPAASVPFQADSTLAAAPVQELFPPAFVAPRGAGGLAEDLRAAIGEAAARGPGAVAAGGGAPGARGGIAGGAAAPGAAGGAGGGAAPGAAAGADGGGASGTASDAGGGAAPGAAAGAGAPGADQLIGQLAFVAAVARGRSDPITADRATALLQSIVEAPAGADAGRAARIAQETAALAARLGPPVGGSAAAAPPQVSAPDSPFRVAGIAPGGSAVDLLDPLAPPRPETEVPTPAAQPQPAPGTGAAPPPTSPPISSGY